MLSVCKGFKEGAVLLNFLGKHWEGSHAQRLTFVLGLDAPQI